MASQLLNFPNKFIRGSQFSGTNLMGETLSSFQSQDQMSHIHALSAKALSKASKHAFSPERHYIIPAL